MVDFEGRYAGNGGEFDNYGGMSPQPRESSHGKAEEFSDSKSQVYACSNQFATVGTIV